MDDQKAKKLVTTVTHSIKKTLTGVVAKNTSVPTKAPEPHRKSPSVEMEDVEDEESLCPANPPRNRRHILETSDGSDDERQLRPVPSSRSESDEESSEGHSDASKVEPEDDEAKLSM
jgi:hypothetical protein